MQINNKVFSISFLQYSNTKWITQIFAKILGQNLYIVDLWVQIFADTEKEHIKIHGFSIDFLFVFVQKKRHCRRCILLKKKLFFSFISLEKNIFGLMYDYEAMIIYIWAGFASANYLTPLLKWPSSWRIFQAYWPFVGDLPTYNKVVRRNLWKLKSKCLKLKS